MKEFAIYVLEKETEQTPVVLTVTEVAICEKPAGKPNRQSFRNQICFVVNSSLFCFVF